MIQYLRNMRNPIHTKVGNHTVFFIIAYDIIEIIIPYERIRAQYTRDTIMPQLSPFVDVILEISKGNLPFLKNRPDQGIDDIVYLFIALL